MERTETSRNIETLILRRIAQVQQNKAADAIGTSNTRLNKFLSGAESQKLSFQEICDLLAAIDVTVDHFEDGVIAISRDKYRALNIFANEATTAALQDG